MIERDMVIHMIHNNSFRVFYPTTYADNSRTAQQIKNYSEMAAFRQRAGLEGDGDEASFAAKLKKADEYRASGESCGATDSVGIILRQMEEPQAGGKVSKEVFHNGVRVQVTKDAFYGTSITIGGSANPDWIHVSTSVGAVKIDLNDLESLMKCLDMFSPQDVNAIMRKITEVKQSKDALQEIDNMADELIDRRDDEDEEEE